MESFASDPLPGDSEADAVDQAALARFLAVMSLQTPRIMVRQARYLLDTCDEPAGSMTPATRREVLRFLRLLMLDEP